MTSTKPPKKRTHEINETVIYDETDPNIHYDYIFPEARNSVTITWHTGDGRARSKHFPSGAHYRVIVKQLSEGEAIKRKWRKAAE